MIGTSMWKLLKSVSPIVHAIRQARGLRRSGQRHRRHRSEHVVGRGRIDPERLAQEVAGGQGEVPVRRHQLRPTAGQKRAHEPNRGRERQVRRWVGGTGPVEFEPER